MILAKHNLNPFLGILSVVHRNYEIVHRQKRWEPVCSYRGRLARTNG